MDVFVFDWRIKLPYKVSHGKAIQVTYSPDEVFARIQHEGIQFIDLQFTGLTKSDGNIEREDFDTSE